MDGRQTVPRAEMTAVIKALLAINVSGHGVTHVTIWSDSKSLLGTDWEDLWEQAEAIMGRGTSVHIKKVKAHATDEAVASKELQNGNWQTD
eukprot:11598409-Karenia_brevis.AAC.1